MSAHSSKKESKTTVGRRIRLPQIQAAKENGRKLTMLTAYDSAIAPLLEAAGVDMLLVGDSIGNVSLGYDSTLPVSVEDIERATAAVARSTSHALVVSDLPFGSYEAGTREAFNTSAQLMKAGAQAVKLEGGATRAHLVSFLTSNGVPVMGHLGYTPQAEHALGGPQFQGRADAGSQLLLDAQALEQAGAFAIVLEMVPSTIAQTVTENLRIPTIGIGAGPDCDGQVLVWSDMAGMTEWTPSFVHRFAEIGQQLRQAATDYVEAVQTQIFPGEDNYRKN